MLYHYVDWYEDHKHNAEQHGNKDSWQKVALDEQKLLKKIWVLRDNHAHEQLVLFQERAADDQAKLEKLRKQLERAVRRYQKS